MSNPYVTADGQPAMTGLRGDRRVGGVTRKSDEPLFNNAGEMNASSTKDLMQGIAGMMQQARSGNLRQASWEQASDRDAILDAERQAAADVWNEALADTSGKTMEAIGEVYADEISTTQGRQGLARNILAMKKIENGKDCRIRVKRRDVTAWRVTTSSTVAASRVKAPYFEADEYKLVSQILIDTAERLRSDSDILEEKRLEGMEAIFRAEDALFVELSRNAATTSNALVSYTSYTPAAFQSQRSQIRQWALEAKTAVIGYSIWDDIIAGTDFTDWWSPVHKYELIMEGKIGQMLGVNLLTDGFREPRLKVMDSSEVLMFAAPGETGAIMERQAVKSYPINGRNMGRGDEGWFLEWVGAMALVNSYAVCRAVAA